MNVKFYLISGHVWNTSLHGSGGDLHLASLIAGPGGLFDRNLLRGNVALTIFWRRAVLAPFIVDRRPRPNFPWKQPKRRLIETQVRLEFVYIPNAL